MVGTGGWSPLLYGRGLLRLETGATREVVSHLVRRQAKRKKSNVQLPARRCSPSEVVMARILTLQSKSGTGFSFGLARVVMGKMQLCAKTYYVLTP